MFIVDGGASQVADHHDVKNAEHHVCNINTPMLTYLSFESTSNDELLL